MSLPEKSVGPLTQQATKGGPGHYLELSTPDMSIPGTWSVTLVTRLSQFEQERTTFEVPIASG